MFTIHLNDLIFFSHHGIHEEERLLGNTYIVDISLTIDTQEKVTTLRQSVNYVPVYELVKARMAIATPLLETLAEDMAELIHENFLHARSVDIRICKKYPPIANMQGSVGVSFSKEF